MTDTLRRKSEHLDIVLGKDVTTRGIATGFDDMRFEHVAAPELDFDAIDLSTAFLGKRLEAPFLISSMTGGPEHAARVNAALAEAAGAAGIAFGVGSQRVAIENTGASAGFDRGLRQRAGDVPILANFGAAQLVLWRDPVDAVRRAIDMIDADGLIVHFNPLQEAVQSEGNRDWRGVLVALTNLVKSCPVPVIAKEVGSGFSSTVAQQFWDAGIRILDVAGAGGTSWAAVEAERATDPVQREIANAFRGWGIATAASVVAVRRTCPEAVVIASGGIRDGVDAAKAIRLGADLVGQAAGLLPAALAGSEALIKRIAVVTGQLRVACFCTGSANLAALRLAPLQHGLFNS